MVELMISDFLEKEYDTSQYYIYVLECSDDSLYTGYTRDINKRVAKHNAGMGAKYTRGRLPVKLRYIQSFPTRQEAMKAEYAFKKLTRKKKLAVIQGELEYECIAVTEKLF